MAVYTKFTVEDLKEILKDYNLLLLDYHMIKNGILNTNYYLQCLEGKFVLRVFEGGREVSEEDQELSFLLKIKDIIPCCLPIKNIS